MNPIELALDRIQRNPEKPSSQVLCDLLVALDTGDAISLKQLYNILDYNEFSLALNVMREWRLEEMRVQRGELSEAATQPGLCYSIWSEFRKRAMLALNTRIPALAEL